MKSMTTAANIETLTNFFDPPEETKRIQEWLGGLPESYLVTGHSGSGKSTLASSFPGTYSLLADNKGAGLPKSYRERSKTFKHGEEVYASILSILHSIRNDYELAIKNDIKTIVIDTLTATCEYMEVEIVSDPVLNAKGTVMMQIGHYGVMGNRVAEIIRVAKEAGVDLVCLAHVDDSQSDENGYTVLYPNLTGRKIEGKVPGKFDHSILLRNDDGNFTAQIKPSQTYPHAKLAMKPSLYKKAPSIIPDLTYTRLRQVIDGKIQKKEK